MLGPDTPAYLIVAAFLFTTGALGVLIRRSPLIVEGCRDPISPVFDESSGKFRSLALSLGVNRQVHRLIDIRLGSDQLNGESGRQAESLLFLGGRQRLGRPNILRERIRRKNQAKAGRAARRKNQQGFH